MPSNHTHENKVAVVTGAARGLGQGICRGLSERGATVIAVDLDDAKETVSLLERNGRPVAALCADVSDPEQTRMIGDEIHRKYGRCDILVNNAGVFPSIDIDDLDYPTWRRILATNLDSQFLMVKAVLPMMKTGGWGRIVNLTSNSIGSAVPMLTHYMASKMGAIGFTRALATDVANFNITVNAVGPTLSRTPGVVSSMPPEALEGVAQMQAIKRIGEAEDIVGPVLFLTSEDSAFVTGQTIMADGGMVRI